MTYLPNRGPKRLGTAGHSHAGLLDTLGDRGALKVWKVQLWPMKAGINSGAPERPDESGRVPVALYDGFFGINRILTVIVSENDR